MDVQFPLFVFQYYRQTRSVFPIIVLDCYDKNISDSARRYHDPCTSKSPIHSAPDGFHSFRRKPQLAKSHLNFRTLLTRFLSLSRTNSQKQRTTHHIKYRTSAFPFLLCILYVLVLFFFQVIIFVVLVMVNDLFS